MSYVSGGIKGKYHIGLNGQGLILQGAPERLAYEMKQAPIYGNRFAQGDRDYGDFSFWWFWTQTDWSGGLKENPNWEDDAKYKSSKNIDAFSVGGQLKLLPKPVVQTTDLSVNCDALTRCIHGIVDDGVNDITRFFLGTRATTVDGSNGCKLWQSVSSGSGAGDVWTLINEFVNVTAINDLFISLQTLFIILTNQLYVFNDATTPFTTVTERTTEFNVSGLSCSLFHSGADILGVAHVIGANLTQSALKTSNDDGATFTQRILFPVGVSIYNCISFNGKFYYLAESGGSTGLYYHNAITDAAGTLVYEFKGRIPIRSGSGFGTNVSMVIVGNQLFIQFSDGSIWSCTTAHVITQEFENRNSILSAPGGLVNHKGLGYGRDVVIKSIGGITNVYQNRYNADDSEIFITAVSNGTLLLHLNIYNHADDAKIYGASTTFYTSGNFVTSEYAEIPSVDKLWYDVTLNCDALASGQSIQVEYSADGAAYVSLGTISFSVEGASKNKSFLFGDAIVAKNINFRFTLAGDGSNTPTLKDFSARFVPVTIAKKLWNFNANCGDEVKRLDGGLVETVGRELRGILERAWWTKSILDFQDLDYATTLLDGALSAIADNGTLTGLTITVDNTHDFPEQGRLRVDNEEIVYTGKTPTTFTGCTRASRETKAAAHSNNAVINNAYKVILTDLQYRVPISLKDKALEYIVGISLREV